MTYKEQNERVIRFLKSKDTCTLQNLRFWESFGLGAQVAFQSNSDWLIPVGQSQFCSLLAEVVAAVLARQAGVTIFLVGNLSWPRILKESMPIVRPILNT